MNPTLVATQILNGIATGMLYALMGIGLSLLTGILNIPNFAHGAMFAIGAYLLATAIQGIGDFWVALILAPVGVAVLGLLVEYLGIRRLYAAGHDYQLLLTFGLSLILTEGIIVVWGPMGKSQLPPPILRGAVDLGISFYPKYRLFVMAMAGLLVLGTWGLPRRRSLALFPALAPSSMKPARNFKRASTRRAPAARLALRQACSDQPPRRSPASARSCPGPRRRFRPSSTPPR